MAGLRSWRVSYRFDRKISSQVGQLSPQRAPVKRVSESPAADGGSGGLVRDAVFVELFAQGSAIHAEHFSGMGQIAFAIQKHFHQQRLFDLIHDQAVQLRGRVPFDFAQVPAYRSAAGFG
jgi:hypothetical protein